MRICVMGDSWAGGMDYNLNIKYPDGAHPSIDYYPDLID
jgi:hypothetical protein